MTKILIADDCKELLFAMKMFLESKGYIIETVSKAKNVLKRLEKFNPDLLITDVFMAGKDGLELCSEIRNQGNFTGLRILLFSSSPSALETYKEAGADGSIGKPFELFELERKIQYVLNNPSNLTVIKGKAGDDQKQHYKVS